MIDMSMQCLIVDDDPLICDLLEHFCSKLDGLERVELTQSGFEAVNLMNQSSYDVILLDYDLPDISGEQLLSLIGPDTPVIMITSNKDFGHASYAYPKIVDYLVKPITFDRFRIGMDRAMGQLKLNSPSTNQFFVKEGNALVQVACNHILFIKSAGNYLELVMENKKILTLMTMKEISGKLPDNFQRVHRSYMVNIKHIDSIANGEIQVKTYEIPISDSYEKELMTKINLLE